MGQDREAEILEVAPDGDHATREHDGAEEWRQKHELQPWPGAVGDRHERNPDEAHAVPRECDPEEHQCDQFQKMQHGPTSPYVGCPALPAACLSYQVTIMETGPMPVTNRKENPATENSDHELRHCNGSVIQVIRFVPEFRIAIQQNTEHARYAPEEDSLKQPEVSVDQCGKQRDCYNSHFGRLVSSMVALG